MGNEETVIIGYERVGRVDGLPCITLSFPCVGVTFRFPLDDAETLGEELIKIVRKAEEMTT